MLCVQALSPHKSDEQVEQYIRLGSGMAPDEDVFNEEFEFEAFMARLKAKELKKYDYL